MVHSLTIMQSETGDLISGLMQTGLFKEQPSTMPYQAHVPRAYRRKILFAFCYCITDKVWQHLQELSTVILH